MGRVSKPITPVHLSHPAKQSPNHPFPPQPLHRRNLRQTGTRPRQVRKALLKRLFAGKSWISSKQGGGRREGTNRASTNRSSDRRSRLSTSPRRRYDIYILVMCLLCYAQYTPVQLIRGQGTRSTDIFDSTTAHIYIQRNK